MRQPQDISAWQEYGGRRRREMSQQWLSVCGDGWKTPDTRSSTSEEPRAPRTWCGSNCLCTSQNIMTTLPIKKTCSAVVHLKSHSSEGVHLNIRKVAFYKYFGKENKTVFCVTSLWKKHSCLSPRRMNQQKEHITPKYLQAQTKGGRRIVSKVMPMWALCPWDSPCWRHSGNVFLSCKESPKKAVTTASRPAAACSRTLGPPLKLKRFSQCGSKWDFCFLCVGRNEKVLSFTERNSRAEG